MLITANAHVTLSAAPDPPIDIKSIDSPSNRIGDLISFKLPSPKSCMMTMNKPSLSPNPLPIVDRYFPLTIAEIMYAIEKDPITTPSDIGVNPFSLASKG